METFFFPLNSIECADNARVRLQKVREGWGGGSDRNSCFEGREFREMTAGVSGSGLVVAGAGDR